MKLAVSRRAAWRVALGGAAGLALQRALGAPGGVPAEAAGLSLYELGPQLWVRWDNRVLFSYRAHRSQKYPYVFPLCGPASGLSLTAETALPYPHHRSLFFACDRVNGGNYWQEGFDQGQIQSLGPRLGAQTERSVQILDRCDWQKPGGPVVMRDERKLTVTIVSARLYWLDWDLRWTAVAPVTIQKTNHALFALRAATDIVPTSGGHLVNAEGASSEKATFGKSSAWCAFYGQRASARDGVVEGVAVLDHPRNPWSPCPWFTRDYGFMSPTPFNFLDRPWTLPAGESVRLRYRVVSFAGTPAEAGLENLHREWSTAPD